MVHDGIKTRERERGKGKRRRGGRGWFLEGGQETVKGIEPSKPLARILNSPLLRPPLETPGGWGWQMAAVQPVLSNTLTRQNR